MTALQVDVGQNWRGLYQGVALRPEDLVASGTRFALVLGPVTIPSNTAPAVCDRVCTPVAAKVLSVEASGLVEGLGVADIYLEDGSPASILDGTIPLAHPGAGVTSEQFVLVHGTNIDAPITDLAPGAVVSLRLGSDSGAKGVLRDGMVVLICETLP